MVRVAVVTGAARGLGRACTERFCRDGIAVLMVDNDTDALAAAVAEIEAIGGTARSVAADITSRSACAEVIGAAVAGWGRVDLLVNSAGVYPRKPVLDIGADDWRFVFDVNVLGTYFMMIEAIAVMRGQGSGHIVNVSSIDAFKAHPDNAHYAATKAAVVSLTRSLALEVAPMGIVGNSVAPGPMATEAAKQTDWYEPMVAGLPTRKPIEPGEVADLVAYLGSDANVSIVGENVVISGAGVIV